MSLGSLPSNIGVGSRLAENIKEKDVVNALQRIFRRTEKEREETVANLNMFKKNNFHRNSISATLPRGTIEDDGETWVEGVWEGTTWRETGREPLEKIGKGAFGSVYKGSSGRVYKKIEEAYKDVYREALIQSLLSSDKSHGQHICKIEALYRDKDDTKPFFYFKMEAVDRTLAQYLDSLADTSEGRLIHTAQLAEIVIKIARILDYFKKAYGFYHNDLHSNNVMIQLLDDRQYIVKFIDFGISFIENDTLTYKPGKDCKSYDLLVLVADIYHFGGAKGDTSIFTPYCKQKLLDCMGDGKGFNLYNELQETHTLTNPIYKQYPNVAHKQDMIYAGYRLNIPKYMRYNTGMKMAINNPDTSMYSPWLSVKEGKELYTRFLENKVLQKRFTDYNEFIRFWRRSWKGKGGSTRRKRRRVRTRTRVRLTHVRVTHQRR